MRDHRLHIRINEMEKQAAEKKARDGGWGSVSDLVRWFLLHPEVFPNSLDRVGASEAEQLAIAGSEAEPDGHGGQNCP